MKLAVAVLGCSFVLAGCATGAKPEDHSAHQSAGATAAAPAHGPGHMDTMMKSMHDTHQKMVAAKTPEERAHLMHEHMKHMQHGMAMMGPMHGGKGGGATRPDAACRT